MTDSSPDVVVGESGTVKERRREVEESQRFPGSAYLATFTWSGVHGHGLSTFIRQSSVVQLTTPLPHALNYQQSDTTHYAVCFLFFSGQTLNTYEGREEQCVSRNRTCMVVHVRPQSTTPLDNLYLPCDQRHLVVSSVGSHVFNRCVFQHALICGGVDTFSL